MDNYIPPFTLTNEMLDKVSSIMKKIGKLDNYNDLNKMPILRRNNRIMSIHSSLAIEANSLSIDQVRDVIDNKRVIGPLKEIQEVKNAYEAYSKIKDVNPYNLKDLKMMHKLLTTNIIDDCGTFRKSYEGVFDNQGNCVHLCPPADMVDSLMKQLFDWLKKNKDEIHPLILSSIFHYEFVFIHPFSDGNGRTARLWQNVILSDWENIFEYLPIESEIRKYQNDYYEVIDECNKSGESTIFIIFMLKMIDNVFDELLDSVFFHINHISNYMKKLIDVMEVGVRYTTSELMELVDMKSRVSFRDNYLTPALVNGFVKMSYPDKPTSRNQTYFRE